MCLEVYACYRSSIVQAPTDILLGQEKEQRFDTPPNGNQRVMDGRWRHVSIWGAAHAHGPPRGCERSRTSELLRLWPRPTNLQA